MRDAKKRARDSLLIHFERNQWQPRYAFIPPPACSGITLLSPFSRFSFQRTDLISERAHKSSQCSGIICSPNHHLLLKFPEQTCGENHTHFSTLRKNKREATATLIYSFTAARVHQLVPRKPFILYCQPQVYLNSTCTKKQFANQTFFLLPFKWTEVWGVFLNKTRNCVCVHPFLFPNFILFLKKTVNSQETGCSFNPTDQCKEF